MTTKEQQQLSPETRAKIIMLQRGITPRDIAKATGFCLGYVQRLFNGHTVTEKGKRKIEAVLGCPIWSHEESQQSKGQMNEDDPDSLRGLTVESLEQAIEAHRSKGKALARRAAALQEHRGTTGYDLIREAEELNQAMEDYHAGGESLVKRAAFLKDRLEQRLMGPDGQPASTNPLPPEAYGPDSVGFEEVKYAAALGWRICLVCVDAWMEALQCGISCQIADEIGDHLYRARLGHLDRPIDGNDPISGAFDEPGSRRFTMVFFIVATRIDEAFVTLKEKLEALKVLSRATIKLADSETGTWKQIYPEQPPVKT